MDDCAPPRLLSPSEAAERLRISTKVLHWHVKKGRLPYINVGCGSIRPRRMFDPRDLDRFIADNRFYDLPPQRPTWRAYRGEPKLLFSELRKGLFPPKKPRAR